MKYAKIIINDKEVQLIAYGYCHCGCGGIAPIAKKTSSRYGHLKGNPIKFIHNHHHIGNKYNHPIGKDHHNWKGGCRKSNDGYILVKKRDHPRAYSSGYVLEHILICEKVLGKPLPLDAVIHHINGNQSDNRHQNLVICQSNAYHLFLHHRARWIMEGKAR